VLERAGVAQSSRDLNGMLQTKPSRCSPFIIIDASYRLVKGMRGRMERSGRIAEDFRNLVRCWVESSHPPSSEIPESIGTEERIV